MSGSALLNVVGDAKVLLYDSPGTVLKDLLLSRSLVSKEKCFVVGVM